MAVAFILKYLTNVQDVVNWMLCSSELLQEISYYVEKLTSDRPGILRIRKCPNLRFLDLKITISFSVFQHLPQLSQGYFRFLGSCSNSPEQIAKILELTEKDNLLGLKSREYSNLMLKIRRYRGYLDMTIRIQSQTFFLCVPNMDQLNNDLNYDDMTGTYLRQFLDQFMKCHSLNLGVNGQSELEKFYRSMDTLDQSRLDTETIPISTIQPPDLWLNPVRTTYVKVPSPFMQISEDSLLLSNSAPISGQLSL